MDFLASLDIKLLFFVNKDLSNPLFDWVLPIWTDLNRSAVFWIFFIGAFALWCYRHLQKKAPLFFFVTLLVLGASDFISGKLIKPYFSRLRPEQQGLDLILRAPSAGGGSFPSNHTVNLFCFAFFVGSFFPKTRAALFLIACLTAFSRVYVGVHFPSDVLGGAVIGSVFGLIFAHLFKSFSRSADSFHLGDFK